MILEHGLDVCLHRGCVILELVVRLGYTGSLIQVAEIMHIQFDCIRFLLLALALAGFTALCLRFFEFSLIESQTLFLGHNAGQVHRETVGVVQAPHVCTTQLGTALGTSGMGILLKQFFTTVQCTSKRALFFIKNRLQISHPLGDLRKEVAHLLY